MATAYGNVGTYATPIIHIWPQEPHGKLRSMLTGTGVGSNFAFVSHTCWSCNAMCNANPRLIKR